MIVLRSKLSIMFYISKEILKQKLKLVRAFFCIFKKQVSKKVWKFEGQNDIKI